MRKTAEDQRKIDEKKKELHTKRLVKNSKISHPIASKRVYRAVSYA